MNEAPPTGAPRRWGVLIAAGSGIALALSMPGTDIGPLALVALAPLCWLWHDASPRRAALFGFVAGLAYFGIHLSWTWYFGAIAIVPLVALQAAFWAVAGTLVAIAAKRGVRSPFLIGAIWVLLEAARTRWPLDGLAWGQVGVALHNQGAGRALASWGGIPLATFVVVVVNAFVADVVRATRTSDRGPLKSATLGLVALIALVAVATATRVAPHRNGDLRYALIQGNDKNRYLTENELATSYLTRSHLALARTLRGNYDLVVFPESSLESDPEADPNLKAEIDTIARQHHTWVMTNVIDAQTEPGKIFNANRLYSPQGRLVGTYAKRHLVPFGEFVPWRGSLSFISALQQIPHDFTHGTKIGIETVAGHTISSVICFESAFGPLMRESAAAGAEVIVVTTNNRSYRRSANSEQHLALSQMNAAAIGRPVLHASVSGITAVIDADGVVQHQTELFHNTVVSGNVIPTTGSTPYVRFGDWVEWGSGLLVAAALALGVVRARRIRTTAGQGSDQ